VTIAAPPAKGPGRPYGELAKRKGLGANVQAIPGHTETVVVGQGLTNGLIGLEALTPGPQGSPHAANAMIIGNALPAADATQRKQGEPTPNSSYEDLKKLFGTVHNLVRSLLIFWGNDERPPLFVFQSQAGGVFVKRNRFFQETGLFVPVQGLSLFERHLKQQNEKHGTTYDMASLDLFLQFLIRSEQLPGLLEAAQLDLATPLGLNVANLMSEDLKEALPELRKAFFLAKRLQRVAELSKSGSGLSQTLAEWVAPLAEAVKSAFEKRKTDQRARFPGFKSIKRIDSVPFAVCEFKKILQLLHAQESIHFHGKGVDFHATPEELRQRERVGTRGWLTKEVRRGGSQRAVQIKVVRTIKVKPPKVCLAQGPEQARIVAFDPGLRTGTTVSITEVTGPQEIEHEVQEHGKGVLKEQVLQDRRGVHNQERVRGRVSILQELHRQDRLQSNIAHLAALKEEKKRQTEDAQNQHLLGSIAPHILGLDNGGHDKGNTDGHNHHNGDDGMVMEENSDADDDDGDDKAEKIYDELAELEGALEELKAKFEVEKEGQEPVTKRYRVSNHPDANSVERWAKERFEASNNARAGAGRKVRSYEQWLRITAKRKRRALKNSKAHVRHYLKTEKRRWASKIAGSAGEGGLVIAPKLNFHRFERGRTSRVVKRGMQLLALCGFVDHELHDACRRQSTLLVISGESYTTKTCPKCFTHNDKVGGSKTFKCANADCGYEGPRDPKSSFCIQQRLVAFAFE